ncbi:MAG: exosortase V [Caulobacteraceae bacterium]|nr:exosortase V [Caulobacteraceae bacterium]
MWPLAAGLAVLGALAVQDLIRQSWSGEFGAYGPVVLVTGAWLLWRRLPSMIEAAKPGNLGVTLAVIIPSLVSFIFGRAYDFVTFETAGLFGVFMAMLYAKFGLRVMAREWFPLLYLAFVIPPPQALLSQVTAPLKEFVSWASTSALANFGLPVARQGVTIFVAQYQLLVEDACSGMNSIVGLTAVSLLYIYLVRGQKILYSILMTVMVIPIAIVANILRIMVLILLTYYAGNDVAQGYLHFTAGIFLFAIAILCVFAIDRAVAFGAHRWRATGARA